MQEYSDIKTTMCIPPEWYFISVTIQLKTEKSAKTLQHRLASLENLSPVYQYVKFSLSLLNLYMWRSEGLKI